MSTGIELNNPTYQKRDIFKISYGNMEALKLIIEMMSNKKYRTKIRALVLNYSIDKQLGKIK